MSQAIDKISERGAEEGMGGGMLPFSLQVRVLNPNKTYQGLPSPARLIETAAKKKRHSNHRKSRFRVSMISSEQRRLDSYSQSIMGNLHALCRLASFRR